MRNLKLYLFIFFFFSEKKIFKMSSPTYKIPFQIVKMLKHSLWDCLDLKDFTLFPFSLHGSEM